MDLSEGGHFMSYLNDVFLGNQKPPFFFNETVEASNRRILAHKKDKKV